MLSVAMQNSCEGGWRVVGQNGKATESSVISVRPGKMIPFASLKFLHSPKSFLFRNSVNSKHSPIYPVD